MWEKCVSCGAGLFAGDAFCGNCGRPTTPAVPAARESGGAQPAGPDTVPEPSQPAVAAEPDGPPQLELGLGLTPVLGTSAGPAPVLGTSAGSAPAAPDALAGAAAPGPSASAAAGPNPAANGQLSPAGKAISPPAPGRQPTGRPEPAEAATGSPIPGSQPVDLPEPAEEATGPDEPGDPSDPGPEPAGPPEPEVLIIPARQVGGPAGPGGRLTVPAQRRGQPSQPGQLAGPHSRALHRTRLTGQANLDPAGNTRFLLRVLRQAALFAGIYALIETVLLLVFLGLGFAGMGLHSAVRLETQSLWQVALGLAALFWIIPVPALLGQWTMLVESGADASSVTFEHIAMAFREHNVPLDSLEVRAVSPPHESARDYLELRRGRFSGYISCFPHGRDLYVGWTFFLRMCPARLMLISIGRSVQHVTRRGGDVQRALWFESTRALVAAMHSAALAGVGSAVSDPDALGSSTGSADDVVVKFG